MPKVDAFEHGRRPRRPARREDYLYSSVIADPLLQPLFGCRQA